MADLKTYSVVIRWSKDYGDMGDYADVVRARNGNHAERIVRSRMVRNEWAEREEGETKTESVALYRNFDGTYFGECLECTEGAIWKAAELERALRHALRALVAAYGEPSPDALPTENVLGREAILEGRKIITEIDGY